MSVVAVLVAVATAASAAQKIDPKLSTVKIYSFSPQSGGVVIKDFAYSTDKFQDYINKQGGVNGHEVEITNCDTGSTAAGSLSCVQKAVNDHAIALVTPLDLGNGDYVKALEAAKIPNLTSLVLHPAAEGTSPMIFGYGGPDMEIGAFALMAKAAHCKKVVVLNAPTSAGALNETVQKRSFAAAGIPVSFVAIPASPGDLTPQLSTAMSGDPDCIELSGTTAIYASELSALKATGKKPKILGLDGFLTQALIDQYPDLVNGAVFVTTTADKTDPAYAAYVKATADRPANFTEAIGMNLWIGNTLITNEAKKIKGPITNTSFLKALQKDKALSADGMEHAVDFTKPVKLVGGLQRLYNPYVRFKVLKNGKYVALGTWVDASAAYNGKSSSSTTTTTG